jgi:L-fucose isomerase-like protein
MIAVYTLTSELHDPQTVERATSVFLDTLQLDYDYRGGHFTDYGSHPLSVIFVRTGGTEGIFRRLLPQLLLQSDAPFTLLTSGQSNSLAASMEILSFLRQQGLKGEIIHGNAGYISQRIHQLAVVAEARKQLQGCRLGIIGEPSDWLISSHADKTVVRQRLGIELVDIPMKELIEEIAITPQRMPEEKNIPEALRPAMPVADAIYQALKVIVARHSLQGFTLRCFDLLTTVHNTGCLALAKLNAEGIIAGCEGDVPAMLSMKIAHVLTGFTGFQANPASINPSTGEMLFAHCTIPLNMVERYEFDTHFESGIGVGIRGYMKEGPVTIFKVAGDLSRKFIEEGELIRNQAQPDLCRTQQVILLSDKQKTAYFLNDPIGNHHIIIPGHHRQLLEEIF